MKSIEELKAERTKLGQELIQSLESVYSNESVFIVGLRRRELIRYALKVINQTIE